MPSSHLKLRQGLPEDVQNMCETFLDAFSGNTVGQTFFPRNSPHARQFWLDALNDEIRDHNAHFLVVTDTSTSPETFIAFAKWNAPVPATTPPPPLPDNWPEDGDPVLANVFFKKLADMHEEIMGDRPHWYLEIIVTKGQYQGKGAGGMMMKWGVEKAHEDSVECYLDATPEGQPMYEKFGFRNVKTFSFFNNIYRHSLMVRNRA